MICAWLSIKAISQNSRNHKQYEAEQLNHKLHTEWSRARAGDFDLTGEFDWKSDRKCSTWRMRRRFAAVFPSYWLIALADPRERPSLFLDQTEARRDEKQFFGDRPPYLKICIRHWIALSLSSISIWKFPNFGGKFYTSSVWWLELILSLICYFRHVSRKIYNW